MDWKIMSYEELKNYDYTINELIAENAKLRELVNVYRLLTKHCNDLDKENAKLYELVNHYHSIVSIDFDNIKPAELLEWNRKRTKLRKELGLEYK